MVQFSSVQSLSRVRLFEIPWTAAHQDSVPFAISWCLFKLLSIESVMLSNHLILFCPFLLLPSIFSSIKVFLSQRAVSSHQVTKCWSFSFSISPSINYSGLISLGLSGLISLLTKGLSTVFFSTTVWKYQFFPAFFMVQLSNLYMTTGKNTALTTWTFVGKVMSLLLNMLSLS